MARIEAKNKMPYLSQFLMDQARSTHIDHHLLLAIHLRSYFSKLLDLRDHVVDWSQTYGIYYFFQFFEECGNSSSFKQKKNPTFTSKMIEF